MTALSSNIRYFRKENRMSQEELAAKLNKKSYTTIQKWESGVSEPSVSDTLRMASIFGTTMQDLVGERQTNVLRLSAEEQALVLAFRKASKEAQDMALRMFGIEPEKKEAQSYA